jgi:hypothetical protein
MKNGIPKDGDKLIIKAQAPRSLDATLASLEAIEEDFSPMDDPSPEPVDLAGRTAREN